MLYDINVKKPTKAVRYFVEQLCVPVESPNKWILSSLEYRYFFNNDDVGKKSICYYIFFSLHAMNIHVHPFSEQKQYINTIIQPGIERYVAQQLRDVRHYCSFLCNHFGLDEQAYPNKPHRLK